MKNYFKAIIIIVIIILMGVGVFFSTDLYSNYKYDENLKLSSSYFNSSMEKYNGAKNILINSNFSNEEEFNKEKEEILAKINDSIIDMEKSIMYEERMLEIATNPEQKEFAKLSLNASNLALKILYAQKKLFLTVNYNNWDQNKYYDILNQKAELYNQLDEANQAISEKLKNPNFREKVI